MGDYHPTTPTTKARLGYWLRSFVVAAVLCSVPVFIMRGPWLIILIVTLVIALPAWFLYLPIVVNLRDIDDGRLWVILLTGALIGPLSVGAWCVVLLLTGHGSSEVLDGDPLIGIGGLACMLFECIFGLIAASFYAISLKRGGDVLKRRIS